MKTYGKKSSTKKTFVIEYEGREVLIFSNCPDQYGFVEIDFMLSSSISTKTPFKEVARWNDFRGLLYKVWQTVEGYYMPRGAKGIMAYGADRTRDKLYARMAARIGKIWGVWLDMETVVVKF